MQIMRCAYLVTMLACGLVLASAAEDDELAALVSKGDARCLELWNGFRQFVAEENDVQRVFDKSGKVRRERRMRSDYYMVRGPSSRPDDPEGLLEFRDVLEVDGKPVRRNPARLLALLTAKGESPREEFCRIVGASNERNLFGPGLQLSFVGGVAGYIHAFPNTPTNYRQAPEKATDKDEVVVCFEEAEGDTRAHEGSCTNPQPMPGAGCIHLALSDYNILKAEVTLAPKSMPVRLRMAAEYQAGPGGLRAPARRVLSILHPKWRNGLVAQAEATYSNFRRFSAESTIRFEPIR